MDLWNILVSRLPGGLKPNSAPAGRWFHHLPRGRVFNDSIAASGPEPNELSLA